MPRNPVWFEKEKRDLETLARIVNQYTYVATAERKKAARFYEDEIDTEEGDSLDRLTEYGLVRMEAHCKGTRVTLTYSLTKKGKRVYSNILDELEKHLPDP